MYRKKLLLCLTLLILLNFIVSELRAENEKKEPQCAQSCVHFICSLKGVPISMERICQIIPPKEKGESLLEIAKALNYIGFETKGKQLSFDELLEESFPFIVHMNNKHFMVVEKITEDAISVFDIETKRQSWMHSDFKEKWTGSTLCVYLEDNEKRLPSYLKKRSRSPFIKFDTLFIDAGTIADDQKQVIFEYPFKNLGTTDLEILKVKTNCGCAVGDFPKEPIQPGHSGSISVVYDVGSRMGPFGKECAVVTNDPDFEMIKLYLAGHPTTQLHCVPNRIYFGPVVYGQTETQVFYIQYWGDLPLVLGDFRTDIEGIDVSINKSCAEDFLHLHDNASVLYPKLLSNLSNYFTIKVKYTPTEDINQKLKGKIIIPTNLERRPTIVMPFDIDIDSTIKTTPSVLFFGEICSGKSIEEKITVSSRDNQSIAIESVDAGNTQLSYEIKELDEEKSCIIFKSIVSGKNKLVLLDNSISITVNRGGNKSKIQIPIMSYL